MRRLGPRTPRRPRAPHEPTRVQRAQHPGSAHNAARNSYNNTMGLCPGTVPPLSRRVNRCNSLIRLHLRARKPDLSHLSHGSAPAPARVERDKVYTIIHIYFILILPARAPADAGTRDKWDIYTLSTTQPVAAIELDNVVNGGTTMVLSRDKLL